MLENGSSLGGLIGTVISTSTEITSSYWDIESTGQSTSASENPTNNYTGVESAIGIVHSGGIYQANLKTGGGDSPTYAVGDIFVDWRFGNDDDNPWVYTGDGQWPVLYWQEETQP